MERVNVLWYLREITAEEGLRLRAMQGSALERNAALLAMALCNRRGQAVFCNAQELRRWLSPARIERYSLQWLRMKLREDPPTTREAVQARMQALVEDPLARLQVRLGGWRVRYDRDVTELCAHWLLDAEGEAPPVEQQNAQFDLTRFLQRKEE